MANELTRHEKFLFVLPLLCLPFLLLAFVALGGGQKSKLIVTGKKAAFNAEMPTPKLQDESEWNKLSFYERAEKDSNKLKEQMLADPYYRLPGKKTDTAGYFDGKISYDPAPEQKINERIKQINSLLSESEGSQEKETKTLPVRSKEIPAMPEVVPEVDPELKQLDGMLDKIMAIQNPEKIRQQSEKNRQFVFPVQRDSKQAKITLLSKERKVIDTSIGKSVFVQQNSFMGLPESKPEQASLSAAAVAAIVEVAQTVVSGNTLSLRITGDVVVAGIFIPSNTKLSGIVSLDGDRLSCKITSIRFQKYLLPVELEVYDLDGMPGINIPNAISRDVSKQSASQAIQGLGMSSVDPSIGAQAATAGIEAAKQLLSKKVKLVRVTIPSGYNVLLRSKD